MIRCDLKLLSYAANDLSRDLVIYYANQMSDSHLIFQRKKS